MTVATLTTVYGTGSWAKHSSKTTTLRPTHPAADGSLHWIRKLPLNYGETGYTVAEWRPGRRNLPDCWQPIGFGDQEDHTAEDMADMGCIYIGPAVPLVGAG